MSITFNKKQQQVINELNQNILLSAGAGTGKTNVLSYRVANILNKNRANADEILCLTFTNKACRELKNHHTHHSWLCLPSDYHYRQKSTNNI